MMKMFELFLAWGLIMHTFGKFFCSANRLKGLASPSKLVVFQALCIANSLSFIYWRTVIRVVESSRLSKFKVLPVDELKWLYFNITFWLLELRHHYSNSIHQWRVGATWAYGTSVISVHTVLQLFIQWQTVGVTVLQSSRLEALMMKVFERNFRGESFH